MEPWRFPWPEPENVYQTDGPHEMMIFELDGIYYRVSPTEDDGVNTGRTRFSVSCQTCNELLHHKTTGPSSRIREHHRKHVLAKKETIGG